MALWFDPRYRPLDLMVFPTEYTFENLDAAFNSLESSYVDLRRQNPRFRGALLCDASAIKSSSARNRKRVADTFDAMSKLVGTNMIGQAFVLSNAMSRGALTAVFWLKSPPWPVFVCATQRQALAWLDARFRAENLPMPTPPCWWGEQQTSPPGSALPPPK